MIEKVTRMSIKVDLQCGKCYRKIKKVLCEFPQIRDQIYDEKQNTVLITVVCCSPEKVKDKICCKAGIIILGIEIIPDKPKEKPPPPPPVERRPEKTPPPPPPVERRPDEKQPKRPEPCYPMPFPVPVYPPVCPVYCCQPCYMGYGPCYCRYGRLPPMCSDGCGRPVSECQGRNPPMCSNGCGRPVSECCGRSPPRCSNGCGRPIYECPGRNLPMCSDGCGGPVYECQGGNRNYSVSACNYFNEENASGCTVM